ncbi:hypothetical protein [Streptomyces sp. NPDC007904]|uniref:hypothetical protein n=1 Tax=Streptomyces sp. NPDC007904 TaxID=3364787 RepID=UPI0036E90F61
MRLARAQCPALGGQTPKNQPTAAQRACRASRSGGKWTEALRHATTSDAPPAPHILRFLAERSGYLYHLLGGIAAAWAHSAQRTAGPAPRGSGAHGLDG